MTAGVILKRKPTAQFFIKLIVPRLERVGESLFYVREVVRAVFTRPYRFRELFQQMEFTGYGSMNIILLTGFFTGAVFGLQIGGIFKVFQATAVTAK